MSTLGRAAMLEADHNARNRCWVAVLGEAENLLVKLMLCAVIVFADMPPGWTLGFFLALAAIWVPQLVFWSRARRLREPPIKSTLVLRD